MNDSTDVHRWRVTDSSTNLNLIESLAAGDRNPDAWAAFVAKYGPIVRLWCVRWGASEDQAEEVVQETLMIVFRKFRQYRRRPGFRFRSWLKTIAYRKRLKLIEAQKRCSKQPGFESLTPEVLNRLISEEASQDFRMEMDRLADLEIFELASKQVEASVEPQTWNCFRQMQFEARSCEEVAERLGMNRNAVYKAVSRVRRLLTEEIARIETAGT